MKYIVALMHYRPYVILYMGFEEAKNATKKKTKQNVDLRWLHGIQSLKECDAFFNSELNIWLP